MKRFIAVLLAFVMTFAMVPATGAMAETEYTEGYYTYTVTNGEATITDVDSVISGDVVVPDTLGGYPVTGIGDNAFFYCFNLSSITISDSVISIGIGVFTNCHNLTSVKIGNGVTSIGMYAFNSCGNLTDITIPAKELNIGYNAFKSTGYYQDPSNWENGVLYIGKHLIAAEPGIKGEYSIKEDTLSIANEAFALHSSLTSIEIAGTVKNIGRNMFLHCTSLTRAIIPDSVTYIDDTAFEECPKLTIYCNKDSYAETYAIEHNIPYRIIGIIIPGDVNADGRVNLTDVSLILKHIAKWDVTIYEDNADVNDDGRVNLTDASIILKFIAKWDNIVLK